MRECKDPIRAWEKQRVIIYEIKVSELLWEMMKLGIKRSEKRKVKVDIACNTSKLTK